MFSVVGCRDGAHKNIVNWIYQKYSLALIILGFKLVVVVHMD